MTKTIGFKFNPALFMAFIAGFIVLWILGDYLFTGCILNRVFVFSAPRDILLPVVCATPFAAFTQLLKTE